MDENLAPIKRRILLIVDYKNIKKVDFFSLMGVASSNFRGKGLCSEIGGDVIAKILTHFPDISPDWLLIGQGEMLRQLDQVATPAVKAMEPPPQDGVIALYKEWLSEKDRILAEKDRQLAEKAKELIEMGREVGRLEAEVKALKEVLVLRAGGGAPNAGEQGSDRAAS